MRSFGPLEHYDYGRLDAECGCPICSAWRESLAAMLAATQAVSGHVRDCGCDSCRERMRVRSRHLENQNKRDLYCEVSFHARDRSWGDALMSWVQQRIDSPRLNSGWWEITAPILPLDFWFRHFQTAFTGAVSATYRYENWATASLSSDERRLRRPQATWLREASGTP